MVESNPDERLERFKADVAHLRVRVPDPAGDLRKLRLGSGVLVLGIAIGVVALVVSHDTTDPLVQRDAMVLALVGVSTSIAGAAMYLRYGLTQFLRFWLARTIYERTMATVGDVAPAERVPPPGPSRNGSTSPSDHGTTTVDL
jgi:hypothetical protein